MNNMLKKKKKTTGPKWRHVLRVEEAAFEMDLKRAGLNMGARWALHAQGTHKPRKAARKWEERWKIARGPIWQ